MDFSLSKKEILFQQMIRAFAEKEVKPLAAEVDEEERFPVSKFTIDYTDFHRLLAIMICDNL